MDAVCKSVVVSNQWFGLITFEKAGDEVYEHSHIFDHSTILAHGEFRVIKYNKDNSIALDEVVQAPCIIHIEKGLPHTIIAKTDNAVACCCHAIYESEQSLFPIESDKVPIVGGSIKLSLVEMPQL